jgi:hypothetical protein
MQYSIFPIHPLYERKISEEKELIRRASIGQLNCMALVPDDGLVERANLCPARIVLVQAASIVK